MQFRFKRRQAFLAAIPALGLATLASAAPNEAALEDLKGYYAALGVEVDDADFRNVQGEFALPIGATGWVQLDLGKTTASLDTDDVDMTTAGVQAGFRAGNIDWSAAYKYRDDNSSYTQHDLLGGFTYLGSHGNVGLDLFYRSSDYETTTSIERRFRDPLAIRVTESTEGTGFGAHGEWFATEQLTLSAGGMFYDYDNSSSLPPRLARLERISLSGLTRDQAFLKDSFNVGASYQFDVVSIGATYYRDREIDDGAVTNTVQLSADVPMGDQWMLGAWVGRATTADEPELAYGGARISVVW